MAIPDIPNMALLKPEVLDSALEFHGSLSFPNVFPVNRASVQSYSICRDVPKCKFGFKHFPALGRQNRSSVEMQGLLWWSQSTQETVILICNTRIHVFLQLCLWGITPGLHLWLVLKHILNHVYKLWTPFTTLFWYLSTHTKRLRWALWANALIELWDADFAFPPPLWFS